VDKAKQYSSIKYSLAIIDTVYLLALLFIFLGLGLSKGLAGIIWAKTANTYLAAPVYFLVCYLVYYLFSFPLNIYQSFILEHKFGLSNQKIGSWFLDQAKGLMVSFVIGIICLEAFYYIIRNCPQNWWLVISLFWIFFSLIMAKLAPVIILPLFFKYKKLSDEGLRERITNLAREMGVKILDVFEIDFSKKTLKANAAFLGWGSTRRVILADTLKDKYSYDEIEIILAHEFAHYRLKHLIKLILVNSCVTILTFYLIFKTNIFVLKAFGLNSLADIAALPAAMIYFVLAGFLLQPFGNFLSRVFEREADAAAIRSTGLKEAFISTMDKLAGQNLSDRKPHPVIKFFFFDHPPIDERIAMAKSLSVPVSNGK
jgi:STE24 endopeptidase